MVDGISDYLLYAAAGVTATEATGLTNFFGGRGTGEAEENADKRLNSVVGRNSAAGQALDAAQFATGDSALSGNESTGNRQISDLGIKDLPDWDRNNRKTEQGGSNRQRRRDDGSNQTRDQSVLGNNPVSELNYQADKTVQTSGQEGRSFVDKAFERGGDIIEGGAAGGAAGAAGGSIIPGAGTVGGGIVGGAAGAAAGALGVDPSEAVEDALPGGDKEKESDSGGSQRESGGSNKGQEISQERMEARSRISSLEGSSSQKSGNKERSKNSKKGKQGKGKDETEKEIPVSGLKLVEGGK